MNKSEIHFLYQITQPVKKFHTFTNSTELCLCSEAESSEASYKFICILWSPKVKYRLHNSPSFFLILNHTNSVHVLPSYTFNIHFNIILPYSPSLSRGLRHSDFTTKPQYAFLFSPHISHATPMS
jgi:hypothetical protein